LCYGADKINVVSIGSIPPTIVTDGSRLYFSEIQRGASGVIGQVSITGGETAIIPTPFSNVGVLGISPSGSDLLVYTWLANELTVPLWVIPVLGGTPRRIGDVTQDASWSADGQIVLSALVTGRSLYLGNHGRWTEAEAVRYRGPEMDRTGKPARRLSGMVARWEISVLSELRCERAGIFPHANF
jgi:hypothetical protein